MNVTIRCLCPQKNGEVRHPEGDTVVLRDKLDFRGAHAVRWAVGLMKEQDPDASGPEMLAVLSEQYVLAGVIGWTIQAEDDKGKVVPLECSTANVRSVLLPEYDVAFTVADAADDLYSAVMIPLLVRGSTSSPPTPTDESTSPSTDGSDKPRKLSKRSSISTIPTAVTEATSTSLDGDSSLSPSSASAA